MKWAAELHDVLEVTLIGTADPAVWADRLREERLTPVLRDGLVEMWVVAAEGVFAGLRFRELSFPVIVEGGSFLREAINSRRFFAWCERVFFRTPYRHGRVEMSPDRIALDGQVLAERRGSRPVTVEYEKWSGSAFLPGGRHYFIAELEGETERSPFLASDVCNVADFNPREWHVRRHARHAKSRTLRRV